MKLNLTVISVISVLCAMIDKTALPYEILTHENITTRAFDRSVLNRGYLIDQLGLSTDQTFNGLRARNWLVNGANQEDNHYTFPASFARYVNHFFDPMSQLGLRAAGIGSGEAAPEWALEEPREFLTQDYSWRDARRYFLLGLTESSPAIREENMAKTFRTIGQATHLIQDMGSPEHTRNDIHAGIGDFFGYPFGEPSLFEIRTQQMGDAFQYDRYSVPTFTNRQHFWRTGDGRGFAEYTNRNFISKKTNFTLTQEGSTGIGYASPRLSLLPGFSEEKNIQDLIPGTQLTGKMKFFFNNMDDLATGGGTEVNTRMTTHSIFDQDLRPINKIEMFSINRFTVEEAAGFLVPRAASYSTGLIDHFFRGKLDLDVSTDPNDTTLIRVEGKNASSEILDGGVLELYADDSQGIRSQVTPMGSNIVVANPGQAISVRYRLPADADKLMAVYKGKLGEEAPQGNFVGGIIGKQLSPQRVEQIFTDFTRWYIRNSQGVFPLPLLKSDVDDLQWGDADNTLVGRSRIGPGRPNLFFSYRINRLLGETHLPLTANGEVAIQLVQQFSFPMGIETGTTIDFSHMLPYKQYVLWKNNMETMNWVPTPTEENPDAGHYEGTSQTTYGISLLVNQIATASFTAPIVLDEATHVSGSFTGKYTWNLWNIHLTSDGRPLALVRVNLTTNNLGVATFPSRTLGRTGGSIGSHPEVVELPPVQVRFALPEIGAIWMLVDVSTGQVLANTAPPTLVAHHETARISYGSNPNQVPPLRVMGAVQVNGGPNAGSFVSGDDVIRPPRPWETEFCSEERLNLMNVLASQAVPSEFVSNTLTLNRSEIAQIQFPLIPNFTGRTINFPTSCGGQQDLPEGFRITVLPGPAFAPNIIEWGLGIVRTAPAAGTEQLVFLMTQAQDNTVHSSRAKIAAWKPALERIENQQEFPGLGLHFLLGASEELGAGGTFGENSEESRIVDFKANSVVAIPNLDIFDYSLLEPNHLYNMFDFKFHVKDTSLESTGLPAALAPTSPRRLGRYHVITAGGMVSAGN